MLTEKATEVRLQFYLIGFAENILEHIFFKFSPNFGSKLLILVLFVAVNM